jgi:putative aminopeptidase FrvX
MHTSVETVNVKDVERTGRLMAEFVTRLDAESAEEMRVQVRRFSEQGGSTCC